MRRLVLFAVLLASFAVADPAAAKEIQSVTICGDECVTSKDADLLAAMIDVGPPADAPKAPAPFYRLTMAVGDGQEVFGRIQTSWVPSAGRLLGEDGTWMAVRPAVGRSLRRLTAGLAALPAAQLPGFPAAATDVPPPAAAPPVTSSSDLPVIPVIAGALFLVVVVLLVRRHVVGGPSSALRSAE